MTPIQKAIEALRLSKEMHVANTGSLPHTFEVIDEAIEALQLMGRELPIVWARPEDIRATMIASVGERAEVAPDMEPGFTVPLYTTPQPPAVPNDCCCENPEPASGAALVSTCCPKHNDSPRQCDEAWLCGEAITLIEQWNEKRRKSNRPAAAEGSLLDGIASLLQMLDEQPPAVPDAVDAESLFSSLCQERKEAGLMPPTFTNAERWAQGWNACREAMLTAAQQGGVR